MHERERILMELLPEAEAALRERRYDDVDAAIARAGEHGPQLVELLAIGEALRGPGDVPAALVDELAAQPMFDPRPWADVLAEARKAAGIRRSVLVAGLGERFSVTEAADLALLEERYHELETGLIEPARVRPALVAALGDLLGGIGDTLAATRFNPLPEPGPLAVLERSAKEPLLLAESHLDAVQPPATAAQRTIDELFGVEG